jgi:hypothetical protein
MFHKKLNRRLKAFVEISAGLKASGSKFVNSRH